MDELDTQLLNELQAKNNEVKEEAVKETAPSGKAEEAKSEVTETSKEETKEEKKETKYFDENYVKSLRAESAKYRRQLREYQSSVQNIVANEIQKILAGVAPQTEQMQSPMMGSPVSSVTPPNAQVYDPRVDDMILENKLNELRNDPYLGDFFNEVDDEGVSFEERLLEEALQKKYPIDELDALALKLSKSKLFDKIKQKAIDETYKSLSKKASTSADVSTASTKNVVEEKIENLDDALKKAMKDLGVSSLSQIK